MQCLFAQNEVMTPEKAAFVARLIEIVTLLKYPEHGRQTMLAQRYKLAQPSVRKWFTGEAMPSYEIAIDLCKRALVSYEWFMTGRGDKYTVDSVPKSADIQRIVSRFAAMEPEKREWFIRTFDAVTNDPPPPAAPPAKQR